MNKLCVRLIFCMYAEDAGIFQHNQFYNYMKNFPAKFFRKELIELFRVLNTPVAERDKYLEPELAAFPYVNGGLFDGEIEKNASKKFFSRQLIAALNSGNKAGAFFLHVDSS